MKKYSSYKLSGIEWLEEIPVHWFVTKIKYLSDGSRNSFIDGDWIESKDLSDNGIRYITSGNIGMGVYKEQGNGYISEDTFIKLNCTELFEGDLIISRLFIPVGRSCILPNVNNRVITCVDNVILRPKSTYNKQYLNYQFNSNRYSEYTELISRGVTLTRISRGMLGNIQIVIPPIQEQLQIVQFLDEKTEIIDKLISTKERKIDLLKQQRSSLINEVVTKGLDPIVKMKDSGVEWIGEIPEHWEVIKIKYLGQINSGDTISSNLIESEGEFPVYGGNGIMGYYKDFNFSHRVLSIGRVGEKCGNVHLVHEKCWINDNSLVLDKKNENVNMNYLFHSLKTRDLNIIRNQNTQPLITGTMVKNESIPFPPLSEQQQIIEHLDIRTKEIDDLVSLEQRKIDVLKQYRQSLISEVVTGKIDVRTQLN